MLSRQPWRPCWIFFKIKNYRFNPHELWNDDETKKNRRHVIYAIIAESLKTLDVLIHPFSPFTSEYLYTTIFGDKKSILLESWPKSTPALVNESIEESFDLMIDAVSVSAAARMKAKSKRRAKQPIFSPAAG